MTVTSRFFLLMQSSVRLLLPPLCAASLAWGDRGGLDALVAGADRSDKLQVCEDALLCCCLLGSLCNSQWEVRCSPWCCSLTACSTGICLLIGCRSLRISNSSLFSNSASASSCLLRCSAPSNALMSHITWDSWPWETGDDWASTLVGLKSFCVTGSAGWCHWVLKLSILRIHNSKSTHGWDFY